MIAYLKGTVKIKRERDVVLEVREVGYRIFVLPATIERSAVAKDLELHTYHHQTENISELYGFATLEELSFFENLINVSGVGPKSAMGVMSIAPVMDVKSAIVQNDPHLLTRVAGIGRKTAERIIVELREKLEKQGVSGEPLNENFSDALEALVRLGYSHAEARQALAQVAKNHGTPQARLKEALKILGRK